MSKEEDPATSSNSALNPSRSTVYFGNISYSLTNNDLIKIVEHCGKVVCAKIAKDRVTRKSRGYAFVQFLHSEAAHKCVEEFSGIQMFGRTWNCSIAIDNGRSAEFVRKREYPDKTRCYECGEFGHLSYGCPKNALGDREPPPKRKRKRKEKTAGERLSASKCAADNDNQETGSDSDEESESATDEEEAESLNAAIAIQRQKAEEEEYRVAVATGDYRKLQKANERRTNPKFVKHGYFSDEEALVESDD